MPAIMICRHSESGMSMCVDCVREREEKARVEERERCAKVADSFGAQAGNDSSGGMAHVIGRAIRALK